MKIKSLKAIFLGSLILVNIGHNIIPHHHHLSEVLSHTGCHYHEAVEHALETDDYLGEMDDPCQHCHAFKGLNYLISFDKNIRTQSAKTVIGNCTELIFRLDDHLPEGYFMYLSRGFVPYFPGFQIETSGLRAPPLSS